MASKKNRRTTTKRSTAARRERFTRSVRKEEKRNGILDYFRLSESYASLLLGLIVVIIAAVLLVSFVRNRNISQITNTKQDISATKTVNQGEAQNAVPGGTYTVAAGDDLWKIAEKVYNDGYKWTEIAKANNITDPGMISAGQKLSLPKLEKEVAQNVTPTVQPSTATPTQAPSQKQPTGQPTTTGQQIAGMTYTVVHGDYLWEIAERAYGDGYKWVDIARANNLVNPNIIHAGNVLTIPRKG